jgi:hypothetical protein
MSKALRIETGLNRCRLDPAGVAAFVVASGAC